MGAQRYSPACLLIVSLFVAGLLSNRAQGKGGEPTSAPSALSKSPVETDRIPWDRARGYLDQGKLQSAIANYGNFIDWDHTPAGLWGNYMYIPNLSFVFGVPGERYLQSRKWIKVDEHVYLTEGIGDVKYLYLDQPHPSEGGIPGTQKISVNDLSSDGDWYYDAVLNQLYVYSDSLSPGNRSLLARFAWAHGPKYRQESKTVYWGGTTQESWFDRSPSYSLTDWEAAQGAMGKYHSGEMTAADVYAGIYTTEDDNYSLLATSTIPQTWPITGVDPETGEDLRKWPGWWREVYNRGTEQWEQIPGEFVSDTDVFLVFDDRWAFMDIDPEQGYPLGIRVYATAHSYGASYAEDIIFVTLKVVNESDKLEFPEIPDVRAASRGLNEGKGFDYSGCYGGFYFDVDSYSQTADGSFSGRTNDDDMMGYISEFDIGFIYDYDDESGGATNLAYSGLKYLDSPSSSDSLDLNGDGIVDDQDLNGDGRKDDRYPGDLLGMTDWHWFDWYKRPGVAQAETNAGPFAGDGRTPVAGMGSDAETRALFGKEAVQYKLMSGDTTVNPVGQKEWYFHPDPDGVLNPHFDSPAGLKQEFPEGLDCVFIMSSGPFDFAVGDTVYYSFCFLMGEDSLDLARNAEMAQVMYDLHYQGFSPPTAPGVTAVPGDKKVTLYWDDAAEYSRDVVTGYADFEGYKVYKSTDGGRTWGDPQADVIYDTNGVTVGWKPIAQFDLTEEQDIDRYGHEISGPDPLAPWFNRGENSGLRHGYVDHDVINGVEYTYAVTAYDMGIEPHFTINWVEDYTIDQSTGDTLFFWIADTVWSETNTYVDEDGDYWGALQSLENSKGTNTTFPQFVKLIPHPMPTDIPGQIELQAATGNRGNGEFKFDVVALEELTGDEYRIMIHAAHADLSDTNAPKIKDPYFTVTNITTGEELIDSVGVNEWGKGTDLWSPYFDGVRVKLTNYPITNTDWVKEVSWVDLDGDGKSDPITFRNRWNMLDTLTIAFATNHHADERNLMGDYLLGFGSMGIDTASTPPPPTDVLLPFTIENISTGKKPKIYVIDAGMDGRQYSFDEGEGDQRWTGGNSDNDKQPGEPIKLEETGAFYADTSVATFTYTGIRIQWSGGGEWPWTSAYACTVKTKKPFFDGDSWTFSTSQLVTAKKVTAKMLKDSVRVVPNPYIVSTVYEQQQYRKRLWFRGLPHKSTITIFTLAGDRVRILEHDDPFSDAEPWDLTTYNLQEVGPGLYLYVVEAEDVKHIGKFAIIR